jgi:hypothetical protein
MWSALKLADCLRIVARLGRERPKAVSVPRTAQLSDGTTRWRQCRRPSRTHVWRHVRLRREGRPAVRAISECDVKAARTDIVEDGCCALDFDRRALDDDNGREGAASLWPATVATAKTGRDRRRRDPVADGPAHASAGEVVGDRAIISGGFAHLRLHSARDISPSSLAISPTLRPPRNWPVAADYR